jgi:hypothetical protein
VAENLNFLITFSESFLCLIFSSNPEIFNKLLGKVYFWPYLNLENITEQNGLKAQTTLRYMSGDNSHLYGC